jgi:ubiquinol-cytochrome c reductase cytochrome b subunit
MGATMQINPVWVFDPTQQITAGSQPDWYMGFVEGATASCRTGNGTLARRRGRGTSSFPASG